ncbi:MAG: TolC family protein [Candidatus Gastranaerophilales bacterium]|nr:TolC family protein [Candidatus Gastranaerophilales bacterium]
MIKKIFFLFIFFISAQCSYAITKEDVNIDFFNRFNDDCLMYYINAAFDNNHDLKQTAAKVEQYRQQTKYSLGNELPSLSVTPSYLGVHVPQFDNFQLSDNAFALSFIASYEADFLLKNRDKTRSKIKDYEAAQYEEKSVYISLLSDVATIYTNILQYDYLIENQKINVETQKQILSADEKKSKRGVIDSTQLNKSIQNYENSKIRYEQLKKEQETLLTELAVLCAISPDCIDDMQRGKFNLFEYNCKIPNEISSDVIFSRPDVLEAEAKLERAKIDTRVAKKEFFPTINITGIWAFNTISPGTFFSWKSSLAAIMAGATQDIFQGAKNLQN